MAKVIIEIPDHYVDWARWAQDELAKGGLPNTQVATENASQAYSGPPIGGTQQSPPDPWAAAGAQQQVSPTQSATPAPSQSSPPSPNHIVKETQYGPITWDLGLNGAPQCHHGEFAARQQGAKKNGGTYTKWVCPKSVGDDWKAKCEFSQWG